jgi:hypothetical protein
MYNTSGYEILHISNGTIVNKINHAILHLPIHNQTRPNLVDGLAVAKTEFENYSRNKTNEGEYTFMVTIVVMNTPVENEEETLAQAKILKAEHISIIPISLNTEIPLSFLLKFASHPNNAIYETYQSLANLWKYQELVPILCPGESKYVMH